MVAFILQEINTKRKENEPLSTIPLNETPQAGNRPIQAGLEYAGNRQAIRLWRYRREGISFVANSSGIQSDAVEEIWPESAPST